MVLEELDKNLVLYLPFSEGSGSKVFDRSQGQNNGSISGAIFLKPYENMSTTSDNEGDNPLVIIDDDHAAYWTPQGINAGSYFGQVTNEATIVKKGVNSGKIEVIAGAFERFTLVHTYGADQDWSQYDYLTLWWYGNNTNVDISVDVRAPDAANYFHIGVIEDDWTGWRRLFFPINRSTAYLAANWTQVREIRLTLLALHMTHGPWYLDRVTVDVGNWRFGEAMDFNGTSNYIDCGANPSLNITEKISISFWMYVDSTGDYYRILSKENNDDGYCFMWDNSSPRLLRFAIMTGGVQRYGTSNIGAISSGSWIHIVGVYDKEKIIIYVNGVLQSGYTAYSGNIGLYGNLYIGKYSAGASLYFDGLLDEIRIYNRALTSEEVGTLYKQSSRRG